MSANVEMEAQLLQRYWDETKALCDQLGQVSPQQEKPIKNEINRKIEIYGKQLGSFKSQFPDDVRGSIYEASYYELQAMSLLGGSSGFRRVPGRGKNLYLAAATGVLAKAHEKRNAQQAISLLDKSIATFDKAGSRYMKAAIYGGLGQKAAAITELNYILANFQDDPLYIEARSLKDEIENPPKKGICFVATAAYGSPLAPEVVSLSRFRDDVLLESMLGRAFVACYYRVSPPLALLIARSELLKAATRRFFLAPVIRLLKLMKKER